MQFYIPNLIPFRADPQLYDICHMVCIHAP